MFIRRRGYCGTVKAGRRNDGKADQMKKKFILLAGPCVIESEEMVLRLAEKLKKVTKDLPVAFYFKASFDKANRTSISSYRGPGLEKGLQILKKAKELLQTFMNHIRRSW